LRSAIRSRECSDVKHKNSPSESQESCGKPEFSRKESDDFVHKDEPNDLSFLFVLEGEKGRLGRIRLYPVRIEDLGVRLANEQEWQFLTRTMRAKCKAFGTMMEVEGQVGTIALG
jgi:hypothetical protein